MKIRSNGHIKCEKCKRLLYRGESAVRFHGRIWHTACANAYIRDRHLNRV